jgi:tetratricopeptide (TPR) repeat protein
MKIKNMNTGEVLEAEWGHDFLGIYRLNYHGEFHRSENGRFILSWSDMADSETEGIHIGAREKGHGRYLLIDEDKLILRGKLERPNDGKVSDRGIFILNDWMFKGEPIGTFYAFETNGREIIKHKLNANIYNNVISSDGRFAVCQTLDSDNEDGNKVLFFDLSKRELVWKFEPAPGRAESFGFDLESQTLRLSFKNGKTYRYSFDGRFLDSEEWEKEKIESSNGYELFEIALEKYEELKSQKAEMPSYNEFISLMKKALDKGVSEYYQAMIHRELGEAYHKLGMLAETIHHFEKAISINPKIGVKKVLKSLKEELSTR